jgi:hypothetical protein
VKEVITLKYLAEDEKQTRNFPPIAQILKELDKDLRVDTIEKVPIKKKSEQPSGKEAILAVLTRAADDNKFLARLAEDPGKVLSEYNLTLEEKAALGSGDILRIESWVGKLDTRLCTWITCRLQQEKW